MRGGGPAVEKKNLQTKKKGGREATGKKSRKGKLKRDSNCRKVACSDKEGIGKR